MNINDIAILELDTVETFDSDAGEPAVELKRVENGYKAGASSPISPDTTSDTVAGATHTTGFHGGGGAYAFTKLSEAEVTAIRALRFKPVYMRATDSRGGQQTWKTVGISYIPPGQGERGSLKAHQVLASLHFTTEPDFCPITEPQA